MKTSSPPHSQLTAKDDIDKLVTKAVMIEIGPTTVRAT